MIHNTEQYLRAIKLTKGHKTKEYCKKCCERLPHYRGKKNRKSGLCKTCNGKYTVKKAQQQAYLNAQKRREQKRPTEK